MIVRLKVNEIYILYDNDFKFQFYDSPIKSGDPIHHQVRGDGFQFYDSPIKRTTFALKGIT